MAKEKTVNTAVKDEISTAFKWFHATSANGGAMLMAAVIASYFSVYMTDTLKIPAAAVSLILLASKVFDGVTDMVAGFIVDRTETKWGKARPYEIFIVGLWICTWLLFSCPESLSTTMKCV